MAENCFPFCFNDGGRETAGFRGTTGDCVVRAIAIATHQPYKTIYAELTKRAGSSVRNGVSRRVYDRYLRELGWRWVATMGIGTGCQIHLNRTDLVIGHSRTVLVCLSRHLTIVKGGHICDIYDPSRGGTRCVYGYWIK